MKKSLLYLITFLAVGFFIIPMSNCTESENESNSNLVGLWSVTTVDFDAFVGSMTIEQYFLNELDYSQEETDIALIMFDDYVTNTLIGSIIEFEADHYYWTNISEPAGDEGEWSINGSETMITLDAGTIWETQINVNSLTNSSINISFEMQEDLDIDNDPQTPEIAVDFNMTMTLAK